MNVKQKAAYRNTILPIFNKEKPVFNLFALDDKEESKKLGLKNGNSNDKYINNQNLKLELKEKEENLLNDKKLTFTQDKNHKANQSNEIQSIISPKV